MTIRPPARTLAVLVLLACSCSGARKPGGEEVSGGELVDGKDLHTVSYSRSADVETVTFVIHEASPYPERSGKPSDLVPRYRVLYEEYPARIVCMINGIRRQSGRLPEVEQGGLVAAVRRLMVLDDQMAGFTIILGDCSSFEVSRSGGPGRVSIEIRHAAGCPEGRMWSLRSPSTVAGEGVGHLQERLAAAGSAAPREIHTRFGGKVVEEGLYAQRAEAEARRAVLSGLGLEFVIERRGLFECPAGEGGGQ